MTLKEKKEKLKLKERKLQTEIRAMLIDGDSRSNRFWSFRNRLTRVQWKIYQITRKQARLLVIKKLNPTRK